MNQGDPVAVATPGDERRSFLVRAMAVIFGSFIALFPFAAGWGVVTDPWRRSKRSGDGGSESGATTAAKFERICSLDALPADGIPRAFPVVSDTADAWTRATNQKVGMIFLERTDKDGTPNVVAFNAECPHLGCFVDFNPADKHFECPCHKSAFALDGAQIYGPSRRGLDALPVKIQGAGEQAEVLVAFEKFQKGIAERKPLA